MSNTQNDADRILLTDEAGQLLGLKPQTLRARRTKGGGPRYVRLAPNRIGYRLSALREWLEAREYESSAQEQMARRRG